MASTRFEGFKNRSLTQDTRRDCRRDNGVSIRKQKRDHQLAVKRRIVKADPEKHVPSLAWEELKHPDRVDMTVLQGIKQAVHRMAADELPGLIARMIETRWIDTLNELASIESDPRRIPALWVLSDLCAADSTTIRVLLRMGVAIPLTLAAGSVESDISDVGSFGLCNLLSDMDYQVVLETAETVANDLPAIDVLAKQMMRTQSIDTLANAAAAIEAACAPKKIENARLSRLPRKTLRGAVLMAERTLTLILGCMDTDEDSPEGSTISMAITHCYAAIAGYLSDHADLGSELYNTLKLCVPAINKLHQIEQGSIEPVHTTLALKCLVQVSRRSSGIPLLSPAEIDGGSLADDIAARAERSGGKVTVVDLIAYKHRVLHQLEILLETAYQSGPAYVSESTVKRAAHLLEAMAADSHEMLLHVTLGPAGYLLANMGGSYSREVRRTCFRALTTMLRVETADHLVDECHIVQLAAEEIEFDDWSTGALAVMVVRQLARCDPIVLDIFAHNRTAVDMVHAKAIERPEGNLAWLSTALYERDDALEDEL